VQSPAVLVIGDVALLSDAEDVLGSLAVHAEVVA
jgi:hypothetical protein